MTSWNREYSHKGAADSNYRMSRLKANNTSTNKSQHSTKGSRSRMTFLELGSDEQHILISNAQGQPKVETSIRGPGQQNMNVNPESFAEQGIVKSVQVSTSYVEKQ
jgi:hypothetical protein